MNIVIGKVGKSILFDSNKWSAIGGDVEAPTLYLKLFEMNPDDTFYIIGKSDYTRWAEKNSWHDNVVDIWGEFDSHENDPKYWVNEVMTDIEVEIDFGLIYGGPTGRANINDYTPKANSPGISKVLEMFRKYAGPMFYYLNESLIPWALITVDPRYWPFKSVDLINVPKFSYSQYQSTAKFRHMLSKFKNETIIDAHIPGDYSAIESVFLINEEKPSKEDFLNLCKTKSTKFSIVLNEGGNGGLLRGPMLQEYVLDYIDDVKVYGKWKPEWLEDDRFQGPVKFNNLKPILLDTKYTFIIPIQHNWVTAKYLEMIAYGVVPFFYPTYDSQYHVPIHPFLRISNAVELHERIDILENDKKFYMEILEHCYDLLRDDYYDGRHVQSILNHCKKCLCI